MTPLCSRVIIGRQIAQGDWEDEEVECLDQQFIVICRNVEQGDSSGAGGLVVASILEPADRESGSRGEKRLNGFLAVQRTIEAWKWCCDGFGVAARESLQELFDSGMKRFWKTGEQEEVNGIGGRLRRHRQRTLLLFMFGHS